MAAMQTTMMRANMTAYSTAVGPSSAFRNFTSPLFRFDSMRNLSFRLVLTKGLPRKQRTVTADKRGELRPEHRRGARQAPGWTNHSVAWQPAAPHPHPSPLGGEGWG